MEIDEGLYQCKDGMLIRVEINIYTRNEYKGYDTRYSKPPENTYALNYNYCGKCLRNYNSESDKLSLDNNDGYDLIKRISD